MEINFDYANDVGKQNARMMANRNQNLSMDEKQATSSYFNTFHMYCENNVIERFRRLQKKLANKNLMFKFDGSKYAIFHLDVIERTQITDYTLTLEEVEDFAEKRICIQDKRRSEVEFMKNELTRETIKQTVEDFFAEHEEKELTVTVSLDSSNRKTICNFHIDSQGREIVEDSTKTELIISNYSASLLSPIPDDISIKYEEITRCEATVKTGETKDDIVAHVLEIVFRNGTVMELGFLCI